MSFDTWIYYLLAVLILTASPGPSSLLCMTKGVQSGFKLSIFTALGSLTAITGILTLSFTGLGVIIASSELVFNIIKWTGAAYLIYLGWKSLRSSQQDYDKLSNQKADSQSVKESAAKHYVSGFIVGASNPKAILFFTALFPQFIDPSIALLPQFAVFALTFAVMELSWLLVYAYLGAKSSNWLFAKGRAKVFNRVTGGVFIGAGALLSTTSRA
ncbi:MULTISPECIES: LysE family translocator [Vibrio]|jgi:threonine/homoserine/homoserine lactone efflux protein|uniref:LysE family translocator n=1 Tax=Vibrio cyclitrophicus ZF270 TaxID=1136176 RepID=A0AAN0LK06_9VIBR|nr:MULTISPECIES: LysE family translocator [Vibrio]MBY7662838.1 LysE family translocator [Vibrio atlanticus]ERM61498.1 putative homoserine/homoserine lactone efflux protein [Vibrio cyclitrophicus FF75]KAA8597528.1 putative homoserine/homoserine lactone efflux protein [Vibrio cyclitrophicus]MBE8558726.1 LysE family translocator [Vibrio sp. OPT24]MBE8607093.1 LysE family translocator [Vibrio sp. OPT10]|tara:strand:+ start:549 stop:1190 length:642 start_codon:yes stop_codon:yes gene_type:complete